MSQPCAAHLVGSEDLLLPQGSLHLNLLSTYYVISIHLQNISSFTKHYFGKYKYMIWRLAVKYIPRGFLGRCLAELKSSLVFL